MIREREVIGSFDEFKENMAKRFGDRLKTIEFRKYNWLTIGCQYYIAIEFTPNYEDEQLDIADELTRVYNGLEFDGESCIDGLICVDGWCVEAFYIEENFKGKVVKDEDGSILIEDKNLRYSVWVDYITDEEDGKIWEYNQYIFNTNNSKDLINMHFQHNEDMFYAVDDLVQEVA